MGVKDFFKIKITNKKSQWYGKTIAEMGRVIRLTSLKGMRVCIDASGMIYASILALEKVHSLTDAEGNPTAHLNTIFNKIIQLEQAGIQQVWIFDSREPNDMKKLELAKRAEKRAQAAENGYANADKIAYKLTSQHVNETKELLKKMGVMYIEAPPGIEAEQYGAFLTKGSESERWCQYMISSDSDVLIFGGNLLRIASQKSATGKSSKTVYQVFEIDTVLSELGITYDQLLKIAVAMGTDFNEKTPKVGPATVLRQVMDDNLFYDAMQEKAMRYFKSEPPHDEPAETMQGEYNQDAVVEMLVARGFKKERVVTRLSKYKNSTGDE